MNAAKEIVIRIDPDQKRICVENHNDGITAVKEITEQTFFECIKHSIRSDGANSGFLPQNCFHVSIESNGDRDYCMWYPKLSEDICYYDTSFERFPLPRLVFGFHVSAAGKVGRCRLGVMEDTLPHEDAAMYVYPFSNVGGFNLCVGNNALPVYKKASALANLPGYLLRLPNNDDSFNANNNKLHMQYRELLNHLKDKDTAYYYSDVLIPNKKTLKDFIQGR